MRGQGWIEYNDAIYKLDNNQVFILPADQKHAYGASNTNPWTIYWFHFCGENSSMFNSIIGKVVQVNDSNSERFDDRLQLFEEMYKNFETGCHLENLEYVSFCLMYFMSSLKYIDQFCDINRKGKELDVIQKSIMFMREHLEEKITLEDIACHIGYSMDHFGKLFLKKTTLSPMEYYRYLKIQRSCYYLHEYSDMKIKEISYRLGYSDAFHFSRAFKQEMEMTPKEYRRGIKKSEKLLTSSGKQEDLRG